MGIENLVDFLPEPFVIPFGRIAKIETCGELAGRDVRKSEPGPDIDDLEACRREGLVTAIPFDGMQFRQDGRESCNRVVSQLRVGYMPLHTANGEHPAQRSAPAYTHDIAKTCLT